MAAVKEDMAWWRLCRDYMILNVGLEFGGWDLEF